VHPKGANSMAISGLRFGNTLVGSEFGHCCPMHDRVEKTVLLPCTAPISSLGERLPVECCDYCQLVNGWVWFES